MQKSISFKNANLSFSDEGKGTAVVLLHGFLENRLMWKGITLQLAKKNRVIAIDLLGHGQSDCLGYMHTMALFAEAVAAVLKHLRIRKYFLVGHSLGGYVSLQLAKNYALQIKGLCLLNSTSNADSEERKKIRTRANKLAQNNFKNLVTMSVSNLFHSDNLFTYKTQIIALQKEALQTSLQSYMAAQEGMKKRVNTNEVLANNTFKKLIIVGQNDPVLPVEASLQEAKNTNTKVVVLSGGHMSTIENTSEVITELQKFIKD